MASEQVELVAPVAAPEEAALTLPEVPVGAVWVVEFVTGNGGELDAGRPVLWAVPRLEETEPFVDCGS